MPSGEIKVTGYRIDTKKPCPHGDYDANKCGHLCDAKQENTIPLCGIEELAAHCPQVIPSIIQVTK